jgi:hypothetical protein
MFVGTDNYASILIVVFFAYSQFVQPLRDLAQLIKVHTLHLTRQFLFFFKTLNVSTNSDESCLAVLGVLK